MLRLIGRVVWGKKPHGLGDALRIIVLDLLNGEPEIWLENNGSQLLLTRYGPKMGGLVVRVVRLSKSEWESLDDGEIARFPAPSVTVPIHGPAIRTTFTAEGLAQNKVFQGKFDTVKPAKSFGRLMRSGTLLAERDEILALIAEIARSGRMAPT